MPSSASTVIRRSCLFAGITALIVTSVFLWTSSRTPTGLESAGSWTMDGPPDEVPGYENPDQFFEYHAAIRRVEGGPGYPPNYRMEAFQMAQAARKRPGTKLAWVERGPGNVPGRTRAVLVDPDDPAHRTWYAGSVSGGLWKTTDGGASWQSLTDHLPNLAVTALAMPASNPDIIYMGTGEGFWNGDAVSGAGIFKSRNRGRTWAQLEETASDPAFRWVNRLAVNPEDANTILAATNSGIYKSTDGGITWDRTYRPENSTLRVQDLKASPADFNVQFATVNGHAILRSTNGGSTWHVSLGDFFFDVRRIELAVSSSFPGTVYASAERSSQSHLYRTLNNGDSWDFIVDSQGVGAANWLGGQGWYDQTLAIHPYDLNKVFLGGIQFWEATVTGPVVVHYLSNYELINTNSFLRQLYWSQANHFGNRLLSGDAWHEVPDVMPEDFVSIEVRFGPGKRQSAHRFSVAQTGDTELGHGRSFLLYFYEDYAEVPFEVWDTDHNTQLMVSFRDDKDNGVFDLDYFGSAGYRENIFIHGYPYSDSGADERIAKDGGVVNKMLYLLRFTLPPGETWNPANLPESLVRITADSLEAQSRETMRVASVNRDVHVDHHNIHVIPVNQTRNRFKVLSANDGGVFFSEDSGENFTGATGYNTTQFYGLAKKPGENVYIGGTQDNGTWLSDMNPQKHHEWEHVLGGDGFDTVWHSKDARLVLATSQFNQIARSTDGGKSFDYVQTPDDDGPFFSVLANSQDVPDRVFAVGGQGVWRSEDFGETWDIVPIPEEQWGRGYHKVRVSLANANIVWAGRGMSDNYSTVVVSVDGGQTFVPTTVPGIAPQSNISGIATHPDQDSTAYILFSRFNRAKILHTTDLGRTWQDLSGLANSGRRSSTNGFPDVAVYDLLVMPHDPNILWAGTEIGLFESIDAGQTWEYTDNGLPAVSIWQMRLVDNQIILATHGRGIWTLELPRPGANSGYGPALGTEFIFFSSGTNTRIDAFDGSLVPDPLESGVQETVLHYEFGRYKSFQFPRTLGVDLTSNQNRGDYLHLRILVDPSVPSRDKGSPALVLEDKTDDRRTEDGSADLPFRATWRIPEDLRDGQWHQLAIPLPPGTWRELEYARLRGTLNGLAPNWYYTGAMTAAGLRVATDGEGPGTSEAPELWKEFEWGNVQAIGIAWESEGGGSVWVDDVYIGKPGLNLSIADAPVMAMFGVTGSPSLIGNVISWDSTSSFGGYKIYTSTDPITDVSADKVFLLQYLPSKVVEGTRVLHRWEVPHISFIPLEVHYAMTSLSTYGVENPAISASSVSIINPNLPVSPVIVELTEVEADLLRASLQSGTASKEGFPEWLAPFRIDEFHSSPGESGTLPPNDEELSGIFWIGQSPRNELFVYAEVKDDTVRIAGKEVSPEDMWQYDSIELGWGNYDVREVNGGSFLTGSPHKVLNRGPYADYHFRIAAGHDRGAAIYLNAGTGTYVPVSGGGAAYEVIQDVSGRESGWKMLALIPLNAIQNTATQDIVLPPISGTDLRLVPMNLALNDADETGTRDNQIQWSVKHNADARWWHSPVQWPVVAMVGRLKWRGNAGELTEFPATFSLSQNYPNPFNPSTSIEFSLASEELVTLTVFDALGRKVMVLLDRKTMPSGRHVVPFEAQGLASGIYFYQLKAGNAYSASKQMTLVK